VFNFLGKHGHDQDGGTWFNNSHLKVKFFLWSSKTNLGSLLLHITINDQMTKKKGISVFSNRENLTMKCLNLMVDGVNMIISIFHYMQLVMNSHNKRQSYVCLKPMKCLMLF